MSFKTYFIDILQISRPAKYIGKSVTVEALYFQWDGQKFMSE